VVTVGYLLAVATACSMQREMLYHPDPRLLLPATDGVAITAVRLTTKDGERLVAWYVPPQPGRPTLLYFGGNGDSLAGDADRQRQIAAEGVGLLDVGYRGYSGSSGHPTEAGLRLDAETAYAWLAARTRPADIVIMGHSLGTGVAVRLAASHAARALVLESPYTSTTAVAERLLPWAPVSLLMWDRFESDRWIGRVRMPVLIVHGDDDGTIPFAQGERLFALANQPKTFVRIAGGGHNDLPERGLYGVVWRFLGLAPPASA
jgi:fermentation-respiration switch protein FrsA (DUF1100 family)